jgi:hypothetical protein
MRGPDDGKRGDFGLAISIVRRPKGRAHLVFDDVQRVGTTRPAQWSANSFFTSVDLNLAGLPEIAAWVAGFGGEARAVAPKELVEAVKGLHRRGLEVAETARDVTSDGTREL